MWVLNVKDNYHYDDSDGQLGLALKCNTHIMGLVSAVWIETFSQDRQRSFRNLELRAKQRSFKATYCVSTFSSSYNYYYSQ